MPVVNQDLAQLSNLLTVVAIVVYVVAFVVFGADLAHGATAARDRAREAVRQRSARAAAADRAGTRATAIDGTEAGNTEAGATATAVLERGDGTPSTEADASGAAAGAGEGTPRDRVTASASRAFASLALSLTGVGFAAHVLGVLLRAIATQRVPWGNMYEFAITGACLIVAVFLALQAWKDLRYLGTFVLGPCLLLMMAAQTLWYVPAAQLAPSLQNSYWLVIHVSVAVLATALFAVGFVATVLQLLQSRRDAARRDQRAAGTVPEPRRSPLAVLPNAVEFEALAFRLNAVGFVLWTFVLISGSIWAQYAWGRFWNWDPKETWTFIIWVVYAGYLHARATRGFRGARAAWFSIIAFICLILNFTVVNTVVNSLHSYSGL